MNGPALAPRNPNLAQPARTAESNLVRDAAGAAFYRDTGPSRVQTSLHPMIRCLLILTALLIAPTLAVWRLAADPTRWFVAGWAAAASGITYFLYASDKRSAQRAAWRVPEATLHLCELAGGWPGAFIAQQHLRHKNAKLGFQCVFWLIVGAYQFESSGRGTCVNYRQLPSANRSEIRVEEMCQEFTPVPIFRLRGSAEMVRPQDWPETKWRVRRTGARVPRAGRRTNPVRWSVFQPPRFSVNDLKGRLITLQEWRRLDCGFEFSDERIADWRADAGGAELAVG